MRNLGEINEGKDVVTKDYVDLNMVIDSEYDDSTDTVTVIVGPISDADNTEY